MNWTAPQIVVCAAEPGCITEAKRLAQLAGLTFVETTRAQKTTTSSNSIPWTLLVKPAEISLVRPDELSIEIDFIHGKGIRRAREPDFNSQPLARALGLQKHRKRTGRTPTIIDATAGLGTDGWMMASLGCQVRLLEASPVLATMLMHALYSARNDAHNDARNDAHNFANDSARDNKHAVDSNCSDSKSVNTSAAHNLTVINTDSVQYLNNDDNAGADIIYLDPMYPQTRKKALVKKGMQLLHDLIGPDNNGEELLGSALKRAKYRVVVKRPRGAPRLDATLKFAGQTSDVQSTNTRYDVYHIARS